MAHWLVVVLTVIVVNVIYLLSRHTWRWAEVYLKISFIVFPIFFWVVYNFWLGGLAFMLFGWLFSAYEWLHPGNDYIKLGGGDYDSYWHLVSCGRCDYRDVEFLSHIYADTNSNDWGADCTNIEFAHTRCPRCGHEDFWCVEARGNDLHLKEKEFWNEFYNIRTKK